MARWVQSPGIVVDQSFRNGAIGAEIDRQLLANRSRPGIYHIDSLKPKDRFFYVVGNRQHGRARVAPQIHRKGLYGFAGLHV